jgi:hypothetical protein
MGTILINSLVEKAQIVLQDTTKVRWDDAELIDWASDGQREAVILKPNSCVNHESMTLSAGTKQTLPSTGVMFIDMPRNLTPTTDAIRVCSREILDAQRPTWHSDTNTSGKIQHFTFDPRDPKTFYVYPKATDGWTVEIVYSASPGTLSDGSTISIDDIYANCLIDYMLYRAYSKDATYASNAARASAHYAAFANALGVKVQNEMSNNPNLSAGGFNPNTPGAARI